MNTLEILNLAQKEENQGKKVKSTAYPDYEHEIKDKFIFLSNLPISAYHHMQWGAEWSFVKEPVEFMDALYARNKEKKDIYVTRDGKRRYYKYYSREDALAKEHFYEEDILKGTWHIED